MRKQKLLTKTLAASMAVFMSVIQLSVPTFAAEGAAEGTKSVSIAGSTYAYSSEALEGYTQIGNSGLYYKLNNGTGLSGTIYGTSNLTYKEFYSGDVSSTDSFDVVTTASTSKYSVLSNAWTDYEKESATSADAADLINELTELLKPYQSTEAPVPSTPNSTTASKPNTTTATKPATTAKKTNTKPATKVKLAKQTTKVKANGQKKIKVSWKKDKKASGYEITYSTKKSFKGKKTLVIKNNKTTSKIIKKLTSKKKYFVKVRSYKQIGKTKTYGAYSKIKTVKVK